MFPEIYWFGGWINWFYKKSVETENHDGKNKKSAV